MDFQKLSFSAAPRIKIQPPGPRSKEYLDYQSAHESSAVSYPRGMPMAIRRANGVGSRAGERIGANNSLFFRQRVR